MTARLIPAEVKTVVLILSYGSFTSLCEMNLFQMREVYSNKITLQFDVQTGLFSAGNVNFENTSWDVRSLV